MARAHTQHYRVLFVVTAASIVSVFFVPAIPQDIGYHNFADQRIIFNIPNTLNVLSNILFLLVGFLGLVNFLNSSKLTIDEEIYWVYVIFFIGVFSVSIGSGYYHLWPSNKTLIWDRLPMTVSFMAFFTVIISERISVKIGRVIFIPLLAMGIFSVWYWDYTELQGMGDLRFYGLVQFLPLILIPLILMLFNQNFSRDYYFWVFIGLYVLAKVFEFFDVEIFQTIHALSGHSLKHIAAATGCYVFLLQLKRRHRM